MKTKFRCSMCKKDIVHTSNITTGYGRTKDNKKVCFKCCGKQDKKQLLNLKPGEKFTLYYDGTNIINWASTLKIKPLYTSIGGHNWGLKRYNTWFKLGTKYFYGYTLGDNTQVHHIKRIQSF